MAITCRVTANGVNLYPELPIVRENIIVARDEEMITGTIRRAYRARKFRYTLTRGNLDEATRAQWVSAFPVAASFTYVNEFGSSGTYIVESFADELEKTQPAVNGGLNTTGPGFYRVTVTIRQV